MVVGLIYTNYCDHMRVSINRGTPIAGWFQMENPNLKWMITRGTSILGNLHICTHAVPMWLEGILLFNM